MKWAIGISAFVLIVTLVGAAQGVRINVTCSARRGLWLPVTGQMVKGTYVEFCPDDVPAASIGIERGYLPVGGCESSKAALIKRVIAVGGDRVKVAQSGVWVNGVFLEDSIPLPYDSAGRELSRAKSSLVGPNDVWTMSDSLHGFDSRYFGPVPISSIRQVLRPWITIGGCSK